MKLVAILAALIVATSALPHGDHWTNNNNGANNAATPQQAATTPAVTAGAAAAAAAPQSNSDNNRGSNQDNNGHHRHGNQGTGNSAQPAAQASTAVAAPNAPAATTTRAVSQATGAANNGQNNNNGQNTNSGQSANSGQNTSNVKIDPNLVPQFGLQAGQNPTGAGDCKTPEGKAIPCQCPPDRNAFIAKLQQFVSAGSFFGTLAAPFPTGNSNQDALTRIDTIISTLQNFNGKPGSGCPSISAPNFAVVQQNLIKAGA